MDHLARYKAGTHSAWDELVANAEQVMKEPSLRAEAEAVARALMKRVQHNVDAVRSVLTASGARVAPMQRPSKDLVTRIATATGAPLPLSLAAFFDEVGAVTLSPAPPDDYDYGPCSLEADGIRLLAADPLEVSPMSLAAELEDYEAERAKSDDGSPFSITLAPDFLHKQDISGGPSYVIDVPAQSAREAVDPTFWDGGPNLPLVQMLRDSFAWGGFPGLELSKKPFESIPANWRLMFKRVNREQVSIRDAAERVVKALTRDVIPF